MKQRGEQIEKYSIKGTNSQKKFKKNWGTKENDKKRLNEKTSQRKDKSEKEGVVEGKMKNNRKNVNS
jgi:hypothetical protein